MFFLAPNRCNIYTTLRVRSFLPPQSCLGCNCGRTCAGVLCRRIQLEAAHRSDVVDLRRRRTAGWEARKSQCSAATAVLSRTTMTLTLRPCLQARQRLLCYRDTHNLMADGSQDQSAAAELPLDALLAGAEPAAVDLLLSTLAAATGSYRRATCAVPFPSVLFEAPDGRDFAALNANLQALPPAEQLAAAAAAGRLSTAEVALLRWALARPRRPAAGVRRCTLRAVQEKLPSMTGWIADIGHNASLRPQVRGQRSSVWVHPDVGACHVLSGGWLSCRDTMVGLRYAVEDFFKHAVFRNVTAWC